jgi:hypothetical protein
VLQNHSKAQQEARESRWQQQQQQQAHGGGGDNVGGATVPRPLSRNVNSAKDRRYVSRCAPEDFVLLLLLCKETAAAAAVQGNCRCCCCARKLPLLLLLPSKVNAQVNTRPCSCQHRALIINRSSPTSAHHTAPCPQCSTLNQEMGAAANLAELRSIVEHQGHRMTHVNLAVLMQVTPRVCVPTTHPAASVLVLPPLVTSIYHPLSHQFYHPL